MFTKSDALDWVVFVERETPPSAWEKLVSQLTADELAQVAQAVDNLLRTHRAVLGPNRRTRLRDLYARVIDTLASRQLRLL